MLYHTIHAHNPAYATLKFLELSKLFNAMALGCSVIVPLPHLDIVCFGALSIGKEKEVHRKKATTEGARGKL